MVKTLMGMALGVFFLCLTRPTLASFSTSEDGRNRQDQHSTTHQASRKSFTMLLKQEMVKLSFKLDEGLSDRFPEIAEEYQLKIDQLIEEGRKYCRLDLKKENCFKDLKIFHLELISKLYSARMNYLNNLHQKRMNEMAEVQKKMVYEIGQSYNHFEN